LPQRANLFGELARALPDHRSWFCPAARGQLWDRALSVPSFWGLATFVRSRFPVIGQVQGFVHKDYSPDGYGDHPRSRSAHGVRLYDPARRRTISVTQMHGLRDLRGKEDTPERAEQARRLAALSDQIAGPGDLRVICGDFNVEPESETLALLRGRGFEELVTAGSFAGTRTSHYAKPGKFAAYMLIDQPEAVLGFEVVQTPEVSDHCPLVLGL
jgi:hypothetical protein